MTTLECWPRGPSVPRGGTKGSEGVAACRAWGAGPHSLLPAEPTASLGLVWEKCAGDPGGVLTCLGHWLSGLAPGIPLGTWRQAVLRHPVVDRQLPGQTVSRYTAALLSVRSNSDKEETLTTSSQEDRAALAFNQHSFMCVTFTMLRLKLCKETP